jgi:hypothetical protein
MQNYYYNKYNFPGTIDNRILRKPQWKNSELLCRIHTASYTIIPQKRSMQYNKNIHYIALFPFLPCNWKTTSRDPRWSADQALRITSTNETRIRRFVSVEDVAKMREPDYILLVYGQGNRQRIHGNL